MYLRKTNPLKAEVSYFEPLNVDWDGNELLLSDILGSEPDEVYRDMESEDEEFTDDDIEDGEFYEDDETEAEDFDDDESEDNSYSHGFDMSMSM